MKPSRLIDIKNGDLVIEFEEYFEVFQPMDNKNCTQMFANKLEMLGIKARKMSLPQMCTAYAKYKKEKWVKSSYLSMSNSLWVDEYDVETEEEKQLEFVF